MNASRWTGWLIVALLAAGCTGASGAPDRPTAIAATIDEVVVPAHDALAASTGVLATEVDALCAGPATASLTAAREAWRDAASARAAERVVAVGPAMERTSKAELDWMADAARIDALLADGERITDERIANGASGTRGLRALEHLLFGEGADALAEGDDRRCSYAAVVATLADDEAQRLAAEFADSAADVLAGRGGVAMTADGAIDELVNVEVSELTDLVDGHLAPDAPQVGGADHEVATATAAFDTLAEVYGPGRLGGLLPDDTRTAVTTAIDDAVARLGSVEAGLAGADDAAREGIHERGMDVLGVVRTDVVSALDVVLGFSDNDGDAG